MPKNIIKEKTGYVDAENVKSVYLTSTHQIACVVKNQIEKEVWRGEIQKVYLNKNGEAYGYDVYFY